MWSLIELHWRSDQLELHNKSRQQCWEQDGKATVGCMLVLMIVDCSMSCLTGGHCQNKEDKQVQNEFQGFMGLLHIKRLD